MLILTVVFLCTLQVTWGNKGATEEGSKLTKAKVKYCHRKKNSVIMPTCQMHAMSYTFPMILVKMLIKLLVHPAIVFQSIEGFPCMYD